MVYVYLHVNDFNGLMQINMIILFKFIPCDMKLSSHFRDVRDFRIFIAWKFFPGAALSRYPWAENSKIFVETFCEWTRSWSCFGEATVVPPKRS